MQTLKNWTLDHENPDGITLSVEDRHLLHIIVLEDDIWRVWLQKNGETTLDRSWLISPPAAPNGETGSPACEPRRLYLPARYHQRNRRRSHRQR